MASIKIDSDIVVEACIRKAENISMKKTQNTIMDDHAGKSLFIEDQIFLQDQKNDVSRIQELALYSFSMNCGTFYIDQNDFFLIGEYLQFAAFQKTNMNKNE